MPIIERQWHTVQFASTIFIIWKGISKLRNIGEISIPNIKGIGVIYFNVTQARNQLMDKGFVYTLRTEHRATGQTVAMWRSMPLCFVRVLKVEAKVPEDLGDFLPHSGFKSVEEWLKMASMNARTLYWVTRIG